MILKENMEKLELHQENKRNAHLTTVTVIAKEYDLNLSGTEDLKQDLWTV